jgi:dihydrofolate reductase
VTISIIVAAAENDVIGREGRMPWRVPSDLKTFRRLTLGKPVIMGRKTFQSLGKPLDGRLNIVISRDPSFKAAGATVVQSLAAAIELAKPGAGAGEIMIIGGAEIYRAALPVADRIYLTRIHARPEGDTTFALPNDETWQQVSSTPLPRGDNDDYACSMLVFERAAGGTPR